MFNVDQRVRVQLDGTSKYGRIIGHGFVERPFNGEMVPLYIIELETAFWSEDKSIFITAIVADPDCVKKI